MCCCERVVPEECQPAMGNRTATTEMLTAGPENLVGRKKAFGYVRVKAAHHDVR